MIHVSVRIKNNLSIGDDIVPIIIAAAAAAVVIFIIIFVCCAICMKNKKTEEKLKPLTVRVHNLIYHQIIYFSLSSLPVRPRPTEHSSLLTHWRVPRPASSVTAARTARCLTTCPATSTADVRPSPVLC